MSGSTMTMMDKGMIGLERVVHPHPVASLATIAFKLGSVAAKHAFSSVYKCQTCGKDWREWFGD